MDAPKKKGMFAPIESRTDAEKVVKESAAAFLFVALLQAALAYFVNPAILIDAALYLVLGGALWIWKSRVAAVLLALLASAAIVVTVLNKLGVTAQGGTNIILAVIIAIAAIRAVQATFKLHGEFARPAVGSGTPPARTL